ncbi:hypothetical protein TNCV_2853631 [Trichonephila clavipes]|uniref:Uncharacterized protein n=1 Tax=Trichonephila clavipes TaxID=2585209 RepID=A0A8X6RBF5_TRICX|nr:hypothetical protein TNCV_2853631 [Trichonephila clavipes]
MNSLVVGASDSRPEGLGSMLDATEYPTSTHVLVKSVGPKVLWAVSAETTEAGGWSIFLSSGSMPKLGRWR